MIITLFVTVVMAITLMLPLPLLFRREPSHIQVIKLNYEFIYLDVYSDLA